MSSPVSACSHKLPLESPILMYKLTALASLISKGFVIASLLPACEKYRAFPEYVAPQGGVLTLPPTMTAQSDAS